MDDPGFLPGGYSLDETDPDVVVLRRGDGSFVAAFSALGATEGSVRRAAEEDRAQQKRRIAGPPRSYRAYPQGGVRPSRHIMRKWPPPR